MEQGPGSCMWFLGTERSKRFFGCIWFLSWRPKLSWNRRKAGWLIFISDLWRHRFELINYLSTCLQQPDDQPHFLESSDVDSITWPQGTRCRAWRYCASSLSGESPGNGKWLACLAAGPACKIQAPLPWLPFYSLDSSSCCWSGHAQLQCVAFRKTMEMRHSSECLICQTCTMQSFNQDFLTSKSLLFP